MATRMNSCTNSEPRVKHVELITEKDFNESPALRSIINVFSGTHDIPRWKHFNSGNSRYLQLTYLDEKGELKKDEFSMVRWDSDVFKDSFSSSNTLVPVKMLLEDGTWEIGFKFWDERHVCQGENAVLRSIYVKTGYIDDITGEITPIGKNEAKYPSWLLRMIPMWNEEIRNAISDDDASIEKKYNCFMEDFVKLKDLIDSSLVTTGAFYSTIDIGGKKETLPMTISFADRRTYVRPDDGEWANWKKDLLKKTFGELVDSLDMSRHLSVACYSYLKSIYVDREKYMKVYGLIRLSNLLSISERSWNDEEMPELWNNLDQTIKGNV